MSKFIIKHITKTAEDTNLASFITGSIKNWLDPTQLASIPDRLFKGTQLKEAIFTNCNYVAPEAFANCYNLTTISFPKLDVVQQNTFLNCSDIKSAKFGNLYSIGNSAFYGCTKLDRLDDISACGYIGQSAFGATGIQSISLTASQVGYYAFNYCQNLSYVNLLSCSAGEYYYCFQNCTNLTHIVLPSTVRDGYNTVYFYATFSGDTKLSSIIWPSQTISYYFDGDVFYNSPISSIEVPSNVRISYFTSMTFPSSLESITLNNCQTLPQSAFYNRSLLTNVSLPTCTTIGRSAFCGCSALTELDLPLVTNIGSYAFSSSPNLSLISLPNYTQATSFAFAGCSAKSIYAPNLKSVAYQAFVYAYGVESVTLDNCEYIANWAFSACRRLGAATSGVVNLPKCSYIGEYGLYCIDYMSTIYAPKLESLYDSVFANGNLYSVYFLGSKKVILNADASRVWQYNAFLSQSNRYLYVTPSLFNEYIQDSKWYSMSTKIKAYGAEAKNYSFIIDNETTQNVSCSDGVLRSSISSPTKPNDLFRGWFTDTNLTEELLLPYYSEDANPKIYAKWEHAYNLTTVIAGEPDINVGLHSLSAASISALPDIDIIKCMPEGIYLDHELTMPFTELSDEVNTLYIKGTPVELYELDYTGEVAPLLLNAGVYRMKCWGASGGYGTGNSGQPATKERHVGRGGYAQGDLTLTAATQLYCYVGGEGNKSNSNTNDWLAGGFNGGGKAFMINNRLPGTGGGATDIRIAQDSLYARVLVAGGGGGTGCGLDDCDGSGGDGGGLEGTREAFGQFTSGYPGTQTEGGNGSGGRYRTAQAYQKGTFGNGGDGMHTNSEGIFGSEAQGAGAGGGWYGGGGGGSGMSSGATGGGGGSGYVYTAESASNYPSGCLLDARYYLANTQLIAGNLTITNPDDSVSTGHIGNGYIKIYKIQEAA